MPQPQRKKPSSSSASLDSSGSLLTKAYRGLVKSILTVASLSAMEIADQTERQALQRVLKSAERIIKKYLPSVDFMYTQSCKKTAQNIIKDGGCLKHSQSTADSLITQQHKTTLKRLKVQYIKQLLYKCNYEQCNMNNR